MQIKVEPKHIRHGKRKSTCKCPIALAINQHLKREYYTTVGPFDITINKKDQLFSSWLTPWTVATEEFVSHFDQGLKVEPFSFEVYIPQEALA